MISLLKYVYNLFDYNYQKELFEKKFEEENQYFEDRIVEEQQVLKTEVVEIKPDEELQCSRQMGVISHLRYDNGIINETIFFDASVAPMFGELKVGCKVEFLVYKSKNSDYVRVAKVELAQELGWDENTIEENIKENLESLKTANPQYFYTHQRSILGLIISRTKDFLKVDTDYNEMTVDLDKVKIEFIPMEGDRVYLNCNVQTDESFADLAGEILEIISVHPARTKHENGTVRKVHDDWGVINSDCYYTNITLETELNLSEGDIISADMIECERGIFLWRCLNIEILERAAIKPIKQQNNNLIQKPISKDNNHAIIITEDIHFSFRNAFETQKQIIEIENKSQRPQQLLRYDFTGARRNSQLNIQETTFPTTLEPGKILKIDLSCESRFFGTTKEKIIFSFTNFKIHRVVEISVGVDENEKDKENEFCKKNNRSRHYANQVWSKKREIIPGVRMITSRRFVANRIGGYEVPEKLRNVLLTEGSRADQISNLETLYPVIKNDLTPQNFTNRFQTLLFIEEIEHFVNFRQYDRERDHFTREGEYLALTIENLAERRPSLVMGDIVRATNPWADENDNRAYDGCIHKVLFNRVLVKFNPAFQDRYNGEDYRLEFFYSRYGFRKQHYALENIFKKKSRDFLFPQSVIHSEKLQCDANLNEDFKLMIDGKLAPKQWCNPTLNSIQKTAIMNILRGEARTIPYVIFGPPGTGKTMTVVETILQLILNMPSSRILVGCPSNSSADLIATRLINSGVLNPGDFVRLVSQRHIEKDLIPEYLKQYCATIDIGLDGAGKDSMIVTESGIKLRCQMKYLGRHKITISTCATLGSFLQMDFPKEHFTHLIVDESGQCTEPEILTSICLLSPNSGQVILAGDPLQLGPVVVNHYAGDRGLKLSFLERLVGTFPYRKDKVRYKNTGYDPRVLTKLINNYRALPSILQTYNQLFYDSELVPMLCAESSRESEILKRVASIFPSSDVRPKNHGTFFFGIRAENKQDKDSPSWYNPVEAKQIFLTTIQLYNKDIKPSQIGIITPYQKQVKILRTIFTEAQIEMPKIGSVEEFQGQERDIVLISTVRSSKDLIKIDLKYALGFACSAKRMNVAISRAKSLLVVCGNPHLLSLTTSWLKFIKYCVENDSYIGCDLPDTCTPKQIEN